MSILLAIHLLCAALSEFPFEGVPGVPSSRSSGEDRLRLQAAWEGLSVTGSGLSGDSSLALGASSRFETLRLGAAWGAGTWTDLSLSGSYHRESGLPIREPSPQGFGDVWIHLRQALPLAATRGAGSMLAMFGLQLPTGERGKGLLPRDPWQQPRAGLTDSTGSTAFGGAGTAFSADLVLGLDLGTWKIPVAIDLTGGYVHPFAAGREPELRGGGSLLLLRDRPVQGFASLTWGAPLHVGDSTRTPQVRLGAGLAVRPFSRLTLQADFWSEQGRIVALDRSWRPADGTTSVSVRMPARAASGWGLRASLDLSSPPPPPEPLPPPRPLRCPERVRSEPIPPLPDPDSDGDGITDRRDACPQQGGDSLGVRPDGCPVPKPAAVAPETVTVKVEVPRPAPRDTLWSVRFPTGSDTLDAAALEVLDRLAAPERNLPSLLLRLDGHADAYGEPGANQELSERRAAQVLKALTARGADPTRIRARGHGDREPFGLNLDEEGRALNRRVEIRELAP